MSNYYLRLCIYNALKAHAANVQTKRAAAEHMYTIAREAIVEYAKLNNQDIEYLPYIRIYANAAQYTRASHSIRLLCSTTKINNDMIFLHHACHYMGKYLRARKWDTCNAYASAAATYLAYIVRFEGANI